MNKALFILFGLSICNFAHAQNIANGDTVKTSTQNITNQKLFADSLASSFFLIIKNEVKAHKHLTHSEHVIVQDGEAVMKLGDKEFVIKKGDVIFIPKNTVHSVIVKGKKPLKVLSIQSPYFDGKDRVFVE